MQVTSRTHSDAPSRNMSWLRTSFTTISSSGIARNVRPGFAAGNAAAMLAPTVASSARALSSDCPGANRRDGSRILPRPRSRRRARHPPLRRNANGRRDGPHLGTHDADDLDYDAAGEPQLLTNDILPSEKPPVPQLVGDHDDTANERLPLRALIETAGDG